jgi:hypothetical protein
MSSQAVRIGILGALSLTVAACGGSNGANRGQNVTAYCVDRNSYQNDGSYRSVNDDYCDDNNRYYSGSHGGYYWYYGGHRSSANRSRIVSGSTIKPRNATITSAQGKSIQRGGFGGKSHSSGG